MTGSARPWRSVLYLPGSNARAMEKARTLACDAIIFDLEDAVAPTEKVGARTTLAEALRQGGFGNRARLVRVNGAETEWGADDLATLRGLPFDGVLLPKVNDAAAIAAARAALPGVPVWAMMETGAGILNAQEIACAPGLEGFVMGTNDLARELGCRHRADRLPLMTSLQTCLLAARAHGRICVDGVFNAFRDEAGLRAECEQGRDLGFDGKTLVHPSQVAVANEVFAPTAGEIDLARRQIEAWDIAAAEGKGVAVVDGRIVENLHIVTARAVLARADMIAQRG